MAPENLNKILLHTDTNGWEKKYCLQIWDFEGKTYKENCEISKRMENSMQLYKGWTPSKTTTRVDTDCASHGRKQNWREAAISTNLEKSGAVNQNKESAVHPSNRTTYKKHACCIAPENVQRSE